MTPAAASASRDDLVLKVEGRVLQLTRLSKILYPDSGFTKKNALNYYRRIAPAILPHLRAHPVSLRRFPEGVAGDAFFEKNASASRPDWLPATRIGSARPYVVGDLPSLLWIVNLAALELHSYLSPVGEPAEATALVLDLDPGEGAGLLDCARVALRLRELLADDGLDAYPKTSGSKGLHLAVPLNSGTSFERSREFSRSLAARAARALPQLVITEQRRSARRGKVLIDWSQNDPKKTTACVYSLRSVDPPQASCPVEWSELARALRNNRPESLRFSPDETLVRFERKGDLFAPVLTRKQALPLT